MNAQNWIDKLGLEAHPEGGYFKEVYRNPSTIQVMEDGAKRNLATSIYFLLEGEQKSHFHQLKSDELWYFHAGGPVKIHIVEDEEYRTEILGLDLDRGQSPQVLIPRNSIFAAEVVDKNSFCLMGCMVNPGFDFKDFRMVTKNKLMLKIPEQKKIIEKFTLD